uniref:uncharacterized protein LOC120337746 n=1 Tax=Styela clava TaxID=7725 RepID=UPI001939F98E|nr:uncharacterized protein LOC120337746 [Styela clava]
MGVESNVKRDLAFDLPDVSEDLMLEETDFDSQKSNAEIQQECQPMDISEDISSILPEEIYLEDTIDTTVGAEPDIKLDTDDIVNTAIYDKNNRSFLPTHETNVGNHTSESKDFNSIRFEATNKNKETNDQIKTGSNKIVPKKPELNAETQQVALGDQLNDSPVETRSSHRLRSRIGKKRGRYESDDYVVDIPKPTKKPKRVLPTRNYDNDNFWQFYRDAEKTIHARNLVLQNRYIKLFKAKDVNCKVLPQFAGLQSQFTDVVCPSAYATKTESEPVVPDTGIPAFLTRYTKSRKNSPELPKVEDGNCPYCGRSFAEQPKEVLDSHMARHNMRYTILSAPVLSKKKKKSKTARKDSVLRKPKPGNSAPTTVVVVDPLAPADGKTTSSGSVKNAAILYQSPSTPLEQLRDALPMAKPSNISMGHRKQTARKSFNIASTLPKDKLIAALACKMRLPSTQNETPTSAIANHQTPNSCATSTKRNLSIPRLRQSHLETNSHLHHRRKEYHQCPNVILYHIRMRNPP